MEPISDFSFLTYFVEEAPLEVIVMHSESQAAPLLYIWTKMKQGE